MDLLLVLAIPVVLALAALRWGADSREGLLSEEARLARYGVVWEDRPRPTGIRGPSCAALDAPMARPEPRERARRRLVSG